MNNIYAIVSAVIELKLGYRFSWYSNLATMTFNLVSSSHTLSCAYTGKRPEQFSFSAIVDADRYTDHEYYNSDQDQQ